MQTGGTQVQQISPTLGIDAPLFAQAAARLPPVFVNAKLNQVGPAESKINVYESKYQKHAFLRRLRSQRESLTDY